MKDNRLFRELYYILAEGKVTATELAEHFEVSVRTIYRDIDTISSAGIPIYATQGKGGGIEISEDFLLRKCLLTEDEEEQIMSALQGLASISTKRDRELQTKLSALFKKKHVNWIDTNFTNWQNTDCYEQKFNIVKSAILSKSLLSFSYFGRSGENGRTVKPVRLLFKRQDWYLYAYCLLRDDFRYFKLSRIQDLEMLDETFEDRFETIKLKPVLPDDVAGAVKVRFNR